jgi:D-amino-acid dehydrogenase
MQKRVAVLGGGVVGVVTAWYLARKGHAVTVIERGENVASGTSHANAGQLSYSFTDALARPEFLRKLPGLLLGADPGILFRARPSVAMLRWGYVFLRQCTTAQARQNTVAVLKLAMRSAGLMDELMEAAAIDFSFVRAGKLVLLSGPGEVESARKSVLLKQEHGCATEILTRDEAIRVEPALADMRRDFVVAIYSRNDHVADARLFTFGLADWLDRRGAVLFHLGETATGVLTEAGRVRAVVTDRSEYEVDAVVVCLGTGSSDLLRPLGIDPAICPVRGYSITLPPGDNPPQVSISDLRHRIVLSRLGPSVRIAGFADFVDMETGRDAARIGVLLETARRIAPRAADYAASETRGWAGCRPMTPDGRPRVGPTAIDGLFLNTGHGMLGWTLACATGHDVAELVTKG